MLGRFGFNLTSLSSISASGGTSGASWRRPRGIQCHTGGLRIQRNRSHHVFHAKLGLLQGTKQAHKGMAHEGISTGSRIVEQKRPKPLGNLSRAGPAAGNCRSKVEARLRQIYFYVHMFQGALILCCHPFRAHLCCYPFWRPFANVRRVGLQLRLPSEFKKSCD